MTPAPIALFVYNRPWHTRQTVEALQKNTVAVGSELVIFSDAPKNFAAAAAVRAVREYLKQVDGFKSTTVIERTENLGLASSIIDGVTRLTEQYGRVIVLEDDLVTSPHFLEYMNAALDRYDAEERVMQVAGYMFSGPLELEDDSLFLPFISSWGWATWSRAWRHFDPRATGYERVRSDPALRKEFNLNGHYDYFRMLQQQRQGKIDSWAVRWYLSVFVRKGIVLYPRKTLVRNMGFDGSGVNCAVSKFPQDDVDAQFRVDSLPQQVDVSCVADAVFKNMPVARMSWSSLWTRVMGFWRRPVAWMGE